MWDKRLIYRLWIEMLGKYVSSENILTDKASGKNLGRPSYQALKSSLGFRMGETLVITFLDRLSRSKADIHSEQQWFPKAGGFWKIYQNKKQTIRKRYFG